MFLVGVKVVVNLIDWRLNAEKTLLFVCSLISVDKLLSKPLKASLNVKSLIFFNKFNST